MSGSYTGPLVEPPSDHLKRLMEHCNAEASLPFDLEREYTRVIIAGMGGSGIAGAMVSDIASQNCRKPVYILRVNVLPTWADENTLVLVVSYSGNTREMLDMYHEAKERGCGVVAITTGGKLADAVIKDNTNHIMITGGHMPRSDIGFVILAITGILDRNDPGTHLTQMFTSIFKDASEYAEKLADKNDENNYAMRIAEDLDKKVPFLYSDESIQSVTARWKAQFNENSKKVAASGCFPEFNHNELEGWCHNKDKNIIPVLLRTNETGEISRYMDVCSQVMEKYGNPFYEVRIPGDSTVERVLYGIILGDYVSLYAADLKGVDPSPVDAITEYKDILNQNQ